jgi:uncharacterized protein YndB with AHSA1/START domain
MSGTKFVYVTYIRAPAEKIFDALTKPEFTQEYWAGTRQESDWRAGSSWKAFAPDGRLIDDGEIVEIDRPNKLVFTWRNHLIPEVEKEGWSRCTYLLEPSGSCTKLTLTHEIDVNQSKLIEGVSQGWPMILASLKSLLETGAPIAESTKWPEGI